MTAENYADEVDFASALEIQATEDAIARVRAKAKVKHSDPTPCGTCHYCGADIESGLSFCKPALLEIDEIDRTIYVPTKEEVLAGKALLIDECRIEYVKIQEAESFKSSIGANFDFGD